MYPYEIVLGLTLYEILILVGIIFALLVFRLYADKLKINVKLQNLCYVNAIFSIIFGYFSAIFFQAIYNCFSTGKFEINKYTGATFYGGLIGGVGLFLAIYFIVGKFIFKEEKIHLQQFWRVANVAVCSILVAHAFGRIGCLMAGCCYGKESNSFLAVKLVTHTSKVLPVPLFEAIFLLGLFVLLSFLLFKGKDTFSIYLIAYGVWRFFIEFLRGDDRGSTLFNILSPSQLTAVLLIITGIVIYFIKRKIGEKKDTNRA